MKKAISGRGIIGWFMVVLLSACAVTTTIGIYNPLIRLNENQIAP